MRQSKKKAAFLEALGVSRSVTHAARAAGISRMTAYRWREADPDFAAAWDDALERATDALEASAFARAMAGDTALTIFLLKSYRPERFRERREVDATVRLTDAEAWDAAISRLLEELATRGEEPPPLAPAGSS